MMNFILAIFLSVAMAISGVASPAELTDTATAWTLSNVKLNLTADDEFAINPSASVTLGVQEEQALLQFEVDSAGTTLLPISAAIDADKLSVAFGSGERVYTVTDEESMKIGDADPEDVEAFKLMAELFMNCGALIGTMRGDPEAADTLTKVRMEAIVEACGGVTQPRDIEINGETITVDTISVIFDTDMLTQVMDAFTDSGIVVIDDFLDTLVKLVNLSEGTSYTSFVEWMKNRSSGPVNIPITYSYLDNDELTYMLFETTSAGDDMDVAIRQEWIHSPDELQMNYNVRGIPRGTDGISGDININATFTGPTTAPTGVYMEANVHAVKAGSTQSKPMQSDIELVLDTSKDGAVSKGNIDADFTPDKYGDLLPFHIDFDWSGAANTDGGITNAVTLALSADDDALSLSFDLSHSEVDLPAPFDGLEEIPLTYELLEGDEDDPQVQYFGMALMGDISKVYMDVTQLGQEPSIQALVSFFTSDSDTTGIIGGADGPTDVFISPDAGSEDSDYDWDPEPKLSIEDFSNYAG